VNSPPRLVIGNRNYSSWSLRPWILAQHLGIELDVVRIALDTPTFRAEALTYSPTARVPVLIHDDLVIPESIAIMEYLSELAEGRGWPENRPDRARARACAAEMHAGFSSLRAAYPMNIRARQRSVPRSAALENDIQRINDIFTSAPERASGTGWLFGAYSIADAMFVPVALRFQTYGTWGLSERAIGYVEALTSDPLLATWIDAAHAESEVLPHEEVGV
jgi:glutathione S-transferase